MVALGYDSGGMRGRLHARQRSCGNADPGRSCGQMMGEDDMGVACCCKVIRCGRRHGVRTSCAQPQGWMLWKVLALSVRHVGWLARS
eukprot:360210-Chlamydomonas_euryale.AAC.2